MAQMTTLAGSAALLLPGASIWGKDATPEDEPLPTTMQYSTDSEWESLTLASLSPRSSISDSSTLTAAAPEPSTSSHLPGGQTSRSSDGSHDYQQSLEGTQTFVLWGAHTDGTVAMNGTRLFVARIPWSVDHETFRAHFAAFGELLDAYLPRDKVSGAMRGIGFVTYAMPLSAHVVLSLEHSIHGSRLAVDVATKRTSLPESSSRAALCFASI